MNHRTVPTARPRRLGPPALLLLSALLAGAVPTRGAAQDVAEGRRVLDFVDGKIFSPAMTYRIRMTTFAEDEPQKAYNMRVSKLGRRLRIEFDEPAVEKGRRILNDGDGLWMYLTRTSKLVRLANKQSFMGSDASNQDLLRLSLRDDYDVEGAARESVNGEQLLVVRLKAKDPATAYDRVRLYVQPDGYLPRQQEFLAVSGKVIKRMTYAEPRMVDGAPFPTRVVITNELLRNTRTVLEYDRVERTPSLAESYFTVASIRR
jgi:outer membrane lipoprotein-sorting protein